VFRKILVANRGEIAVRVDACVRESEIQHRGGVLRCRPQIAARALRRQAYPIGPAPSTGKLSAHATASSTRRAAAAPSDFTPGYGFLAENPDSRAPAKMRE